MSAEEIALVVADIKAKKVNVMDRSEAGQKTALLASDLVDDPVVVDATLIYEDLASSSKPVLLYEDHPCIAPPWEEAAVCYQNEHGNVVAMHCSTAAYNSSKGAPWNEAKENPVDWQRVKWLTHVFVYIGGTGRSFSTGKRGPFPTSGPMHLWIFAIYENGEPADLHWVQLDVAYPMKSWDMAHLVVLGALNFMNCRNTQLVEPKRQRAERRRIERTGVRVSTINVFAIGKQYEAKAGDHQNGGVPLTSVRGHFATYGPEYGKGKLFGKYSGRYWIPQYARGNKEDGEVKNNYVLRPEEVQ